MKKIVYLCFAVILFITGFFTVGEEEKTDYGEELKGRYEYEDYDRAKACRQCHVDFYYQWEQSLMAQAFTHEWDEIEYFDVAVEHAKRNPDFKPVVDGCNGCHTPTAFLTGDLPPSKPENGTRANESITCDFCHTVSDYDEDKLYNFSYHSEPGDVKYGNRGGSESPHHDGMKTDILGSAKFCANCHNEKSPWGVYVKSTYTEWLEGPYSDEGVTCRRCHMPETKGIRAITDDDVHPDIRNHTFHGGHYETKTSGAVDVLIHPDGRVFELADRAVFKVLLYNQKAGHKIPTGSVEDRLLHLHVEATDSAGKTYHIPVDKKGFEGEEYTIAADTREYRDFADMIDVPEGFDGLPRDGVPIGDRIFRMPYFTDDGVMTICQWNTAKLGVDYRIGPRETKEEIFSWTIPDDIAPGEVTVRAALKYQLLVKPVADFLDVPEEESRMRLIGASETVIEVF